MSGGDDDENFRRGSPEVGGCPESDASTQAAGFGTWTTGYLTSAGSWVFGSASLTTVSEPVYSNLGGKAAGK